MEQTPDFNPSNVTDTVETNAHIVALSSELTEEQKATARYHHIEWFKAEEAGHKNLAAEHLEDAESALNGIVHPEQATSKSLAQTALQGLKRLFTKAS